MNTFGERLSYLRKIKQKTQDDIALAVGTTKSTISKYERNLVDPTLESAKNLANYFMVSLDWLAGNVVDEDELKQDNIPKDYIDVVKDAISKQVLSHDIKEAVAFISSIKKR